VLTAEQHKQWDEDGFVILRRLLDPPLVKAQLDRAVELCRLEAAGERMPKGAFIAPEKNSWPGATHPEDFVSKVFLLHHWDPVFGPVSRDPRILAAVSDLLGPDLDCFLSQFIFKNPGAIGQPWHQDSFYFPFEPDRQVGIWIAVTAATADNGPLWVLPGSHREAVHDHVPDTRESANFGYVEIVDHDMGGEICVLMEPGDVLMFDSHLMHRSVDNGSDTLRAAMVYHYGVAGTIDHTGEVLSVAGDALGDIPEDAVERIETAKDDGYYLWTPVLRAGEPAFPSQGGRRECN
jgi:ectoine hydroxylase-related dioxygenase (phytanoyl-CoA dioxygenase family)